MSMSKTSQSSDCSLPTGYAKALEEQSHFLRFPIPPDGAEKCCCIATRRIETPRLGYTKEL